jgi:hypothetical protein
MDDLMSFDAMPVISAYTADDAVADGCMVDLLPPPSETILPIREIDSMDSYLRNYGKILGKKAIHALAPLHVPNRDPLPNFDAMLREPFPCQQHVIAAAVKMLDKVSNGFIVGEMGTGKTLLGMLAVHYHAMRSRKQGGSGGKYRGLILCPDHLVGKWVREIEETIPNAIVTRFGPQGGGDDDKPVKGKRTKKGDPKPDSKSKASLRDVVALFGKAEGHRWEKPKGAEWYVLGRNQAKWLSDWSGMADGRPGFAAIDNRLCEIATTAVTSYYEGCVPATTNTTFEIPFPTPVAARQHCLSSKSVVVDHVQIVDDKGYSLYDKNGRAVRKFVFGRVHYCPSCGQVVSDKKGVPLAAKDLQSNTKKSTQKTCRGTYLQMLASGPEKKSHGLDRIPVPSQLATIGGKIDAEINHGGYKWVVKACKSPLYNYTSRPYRWSPARVIQKKCKRMFKYLVIDEVHEQKSDESAQSMAASKLIGSVDHVIALTGTIIGGYANHLYPLLMRIAPKSLREEGFEWGKDMAFSEAYGRIDRIVTIKEEDSGPGAVRGNVKSMRRAKSGARNERKCVRPGVMPTMFGRHMIGSCMFITLEEMSSELPDLFEYVGGPVGRSPEPGDFVNPADYTDAAERHEQTEDGWFEMACDMEYEQKQEYQRVMATIEFVNRELLRKGSMKLLGRYLWTGLDYPDKPFGWGHDPDYLKAVKRAQSDGQEVALGHTLGFWDKPGDRSMSNFVGVVTPADCPESRIYPKERALIDICLKQKEDGRQTWVYVQMTGERNIQPRLKRLLEEAGLKVEVLRSDDVEPIDREEWIEKNGRDYDVMISHPQLVSTGLDLFSKKQGGHNYSTLVFYETGYNLFTMRQAARRAWRIGQPLDCRVYYLYYKETMQHKAMTLMSKKMAAAQALEGEFSEDGLAAMAGEDNLQMALAKNLSERIDDSDMQRTWGKVKSGPKKAKKGFAALGSGLKPSPLDKLPIELQIVASTMIDNAGKPVPPDALAGFGELADKLRALDLGFDALDANEEFAAREHEADDEEDGEDWGEARAQAEKDEMYGETEFDEDFDDEYVPPADDDDIDMVMSEEVLAKMFANMLAHGLEVG